MSLVSDKRTDEITFETLGNFFQLIDVSKDTDEVNVKEDEVKKQREIRFCKTFWKFFTNDFGGKIKVEPVIEIFLQLYTSDLSHYTEVEKNISSKYIS
jgi:hypothetical protein